MRFRLELEFDGTDYVGWQRQDNGPSIQQTLESAVQNMLGEKVKAIAAGRTDAGVHAIALTVHFDLARSIGSDRLQAGLNHHLRHSAIAVLNVRPVSDEFHARFSASSRHYLYRILNRRGPPTWQSRLVWHISQPLDEEAMHRSAQMLIGHHDFSSFRASECQAKSPIKTLSRVDVSREHNEVLIHVSAPSFLHHQVRNIAGTLVLVGRGARPVAFVRDALEARDRKAAGPTAPAGGLFFVRACYEEDDSVRAAS